MDRGPEGRSPSAAAVADYTPHPVGGSRVKYQLHPRKGPRGRRLIETTDLHPNDTLQANPDHPLAALTDASREDAMIRDFARVLVAVARRKTRTAVEKEKIHED